MKIIINRYQTDKNQTTGELRVIDDRGYTVFVCPCIERGDLDNMRNVSNVPAGKYPLVLEWSPRFKRELYELKNVPNRSECKIHASNYWHQLNGCIAPGSYLKDLNGDKYMDVAASRRALNDLHRVMNGIRNTTITINEHYERT